jgi:hypothetical protein
MAKQIIGITGYARSGKDTLGAALVKRGFTRVAFADGVREALVRLDPTVEVGFPTGDGGITHAARWPLSKAVRIFGWEDLKNRCPEYRVLAQRMGDDVVRQMFGDNAWIQLATLKILACEGPVVVTDVRYPNEADAIRALGGTVVRVSRSGVGPANDHPSETLVDTIAADRVFANDAGLDQIEDFAKQIVVWAALASTVEVAS